MAKKEIPTAGKPHRNDKAGEAPDRWEIRKGRTVYVVSHLEDCGYTDAALESLRKAGYSLYKNGKCVMKGRTA